MTNKISLNIKKHIVYTIFIIFIFVLQTTPNFMLIKNISPMLLFAVATIIPLFEDDFIGGLYSIGIGMMTDTTSSEFFGFNAIILCILCVLIGLFIKNYLYPNLIFYVLSVFFVTFCTLSLQFVFSYGIWKLDSIKKLFYQKVIWVTVYTALTSPVFYFLFKKLNNNFIKKQKDFL